MRKRAGLEGAAEGENKVNSTGWLTSAKKDGQPIIHADTGPRGLLRRRRVRRSSSSSEVADVIEEGRTVDHSR